MLFYKLRIRRLLLKFYCREELWDADGILWYLLCFIASGTLNKLRSSCTQRAVIGSHLETAGDLWLSFWVKDLSHLFTAISPKESHDESWWARLAVTLPSPWRPPPFACAPQRCPCPPHLQAGGVQPASGQRQQDPSLSVCPVRLYLACRQAARWNAHLPQPRSASRIPLNGSTAPVSNFYDVWDWATNLMIVGGGKSQFVEKSV